jgi:hypothetical protein
MLEKSSSTAACCFDTLSMQQRLNFLPLPHEQGSFRPSFILNCPSFKK